jgi:FAD:protein FMN transferase
VSDHGVASADFPGLGTTIVVSVADTGALEMARQIVEDHVRSLDLAASRFRPDSELSRVNAAGGRPVAVSDLLLEALEDALEAARLTDGRVVPTAGEAVALLGYDRDFSAVQRCGGPVRARIGPVPGWRAVRVDRATSSVTIPAGVSLDLGATAKAGCADRAARAVAGATGSGVLVGMGGDIAVAGDPPPGGWTIAVSDRHDAPCSSAGISVSISGGGVASSGTAARRWRRGGQVLHHLVDPATGRSASRCWRTATVVADSCLRANTASTTAIILGRQAVAWLESRGLSARLASEDGEVLGVGAWPSDALVQTPPMAGRAS